MKIIRLININVQRYRIHNLRSYDVILHISTCGFGILANFDAVLRFLTLFFMRFRSFWSPLTPPQKAEHQKTQPGSSSLSSDTSGKQVEFKLSPVCVQDPFELKHNLTPKGGLPYKRGGDARRKFWIKPLKETNVGVAKAFLTPKWDRFKTQTNKKYSDF